MKILKRSFKKWGEGYVTLIPTDDEDLWHIYNLIQKGDHIKMKTRRKIIDQRNVTGLKKVQAKMLTLTLLIVDIDYFSEGDRLAISIKGRNAEQNDYLKIGQYHTFCVDLDTKITIFKQCWSQYEINLVKQFSTISFGVQIAAMVMDQGIAHLCYVKPSITLLKQKIQKNISKKSSGQQVYKKSIGKFFNECYLAVKSLDFQKIKCFVIASPGFVNQQFHKYVKSQLEAQNDKYLIKCLEKFILVKCSTGYLTSLNEVLSNPTIMSKMQNTKAINQSKILDRFYQVMQKTENRVAYGEKDVIRCMQMKAIQTLLISDHLFRSKDFKKRKLYNDIVDQVRHFGGQTVIFSSLHQSGQKLKHITGLAAILKYDVEPLEQDNQPEQEQEKALQKQEQENSQDQMPKFDAGKISQGNQNSQEDSDEQKN